MSPDDQIPPATPGGEGDFGQTSPPAATGGEDDARRRAAQAQSFVRHELRTPLAVLQPVLDMLLDGTAGELEPRQRDYVAMLERNAARLGGMISSLVETGWLEVAQLPPADQSVEVVPLLRELARLVPAQLDGSPQVDVSGPDASAGTGRLFVLADPHRLRLAMRNILINACTFTPAAGIVTAAAGAGGGCVVIEIRDNGCGIPADELPKVFDLGYQGAAARELRDRGLGLGLAVTRGFVEEAGGSVTLESEAGRGTTVVVTLPAVTV